VLHNKYTDIIRRKSRFCLVKLDNRSHHDRNSPLSRRVAGNLNFGVPRPEITHHQHTWLVPDAPLTLSDMHLPATQVDNPTLNGSAFTNATGSLFSSLVCKVAPSNPMTIQNRVQRVSRGVAPLQSGTRLSWTLDIGQKSQNRLQ
jgi:hypothetical protein